MRLGTARFALLAWLAVAAPAVARADVPKPVDKKVCIAAAERGQELKREGKLRDARGQFSLCANASCPAAIRGECDRWAAEADGALASVKLEAVDGQGKPLPDVKVIIDGTTWADSIPDEAIVLDPGSHQVRFEHGADAPVVRNVVLAMGERGAKVRAAFASAPPPPPAASPAPPPPQPERSPGGSLVPAFVAGGVGVVALGAAGTFWLLGSSELDDARARCAGGCPPGTEADDARQMHLIGDVALGVGVVALALSAYFVFTREKTPQPIVRF